MPNAIDCLVNLLENPHSENRWKALKLCYNKDIEEAEAIEHFIKHKFGEHETDNLPASKEQEPIN